MSKLLFEIGTEELPAGFIEQALQQMTSLFRKHSKDLRIQHGSIQVFGTPRRIALCVDDLSEYQEDVTEEIVGPSAKAGLDDNGEFTKAAVGFAKSKGAVANDLQKVDTPKGEYLMLIREVQGEATFEHLPSILSAIIGELSFPKSMRWGANKLSFGRPIQWLLAIYDERIIEFEYEGLQSSNTTMGHRFHNNVAIQIENPSTYEEQLHKAGVISDIEKRRNEVVETIKTAVTATESLAGGEVFIDENLLDTVTQLVEYPTGICGTFDNKFLELPDEVLVTSMREHQKYFPVVDSAGKLMAGFVAVNNTRTEDSSITRKGHQRVLRARLEDALFFYNADKSKKLEDLLPSLEGIIFQAKLGTMYEKSERIVKLSRLLADIIAPSTVDDVSRAGQLAKADLLTEMVGEFPSLQGVMGHAYALIEGEKQEVALAIQEHYMPKRAGSESPSSLTGAIVGLADRFDTLSGCFGIGQSPTGTTDPFGLRRIALGILQIVRDFNVELSLREVVLKALALYGEKVNGSYDTVETILNFIEGRYRNDCIARGYDAGAIDAAVSIGFDNANDCTNRIQALAEIKGDASFGVLASSYKRIKNIIKDNKESEVQKSLLVDDAEKNLHTLLVEVRNKTLPLLKDKEYYEALQVMLKMKEPVDVFFDKVMVMDEDPAIRQNRLNLLTGLGEVVLQIGDISKMQE